MGLMNSGRKYLLVILAAVCGIFYLCGTSLSEEKPLACLSMVALENSFNQQRGLVFDQVLGEMGYRTKVAYSESSVERQLRQLEDMLVEKPAILQLSIAADSIRYEELLEKAQKQGTKVIVTGSRTIAHCDVMPEHDEIIKGAAVCSMVSEFLDKNWPEAGSGEVNVLLLEGSTVEDHIRMCAGYKLLTEKYLRYFDVETLEFVHEEKEGTVYYTDFDGKRRQVEEEAGGLILRKDGSAVQNPYYDERVKLYYAQNRNVISALDAQEAIDQFVFSENGSRLGIVISFSSDAADAANKRMLMYHEEGILEYGLDHLGVFGTDDTEENRELLLKSSDQESVYRGFVCYEDLEQEIAGMVELALKTEEETPVYYQLRVQTGKLDDTGKKILIEKDIRVPWEDPDMFFSEMEEE